MTVARRLALCARRLARLPNAYIPNGSAQLDESARWSDARVGTSITITVAINEGAASAKHSCPDRDAR
jgi:hypothetical protein